MPDFVQWSLDAIREEGAALSWLEEERFPWAKTTVYALDQILNGKTIILITDEKRKWFEKYIIDNINNDILDRPLVPIISIESLYAHYSNITGGEMIEIVEGMIEQSFQDNYFFWYIGKGDDPRCDIAKRHDESYFWIFDEEFNNAFQLRSYDKYLDIKLLQLYKLFDKSLNAAIYAEVDTSA